MQYMANMQFGTSIPLSTVTSPAFSARAGKRDDSDMAFSAKRELVSTLMECIDALPHGWHTNIKSSYGGGYEGFNMDSSQLAASKVMHSLMLYTIETRATSKEEKEEAKLEFSSIVSRATSSGRARRERRFLKKVKDDAIKAVERYKGYAKEFGLDIDVEF